ncbi:helix-turn-helix domain-containing protein [Aliikangiella coralliicola]|uniref:AraC family transcriptional regulator n=1 Tax=Aliikangiella coralliicola TaxID=2592383 RepID=A0A545U7G0_9GAMM|nr:AraC family transcriptional regulator [Aliikangiella coralliicola]TQV85405.1 AraC family transcriptional regulator [Aliikangiella coralliicola]
MSLISIVLLLGGFHGFYLSYALYQCNDRKNNANLILSLLIFTLSVSLIEGLLDDNGYLRSFPHLVGITEPLIFLYAPLLYLYTRRLTSADYFRANIVHFFPAILLVLICLPFYFSSVEIKQDFLYSPNIQSDIGQFYDDLFEFWVTPFAYVIVGIYLACVLKRLLRHKKSIADQFSYSEKINLNWLFLITVSLVVLYLLWIFDEVKFIYIEACEEGIIKTGCDPLALLWDQPVRFAEVGMVLSIYLFSLLGLKQPGIFNRPVVENKIEALQTPEQELSNADEKIGSDLSKSPKIEILSEKYKNSAVDHEQANAIFEELQNYVASQQPFLDSALSLDQLSKATEIPRHYLSQAINQCAEQNFFDYINRFRVEEAKRLLQAELNTSVLDISLAAGFKSRSAFYNAFKKNTGITPNQFRKNIQNPSR